MGVPVYDPNLPNDEDVDARKIVRSLYPSAYITDQNRPKDSALALKNPKSSHIGRWDTVDIRPSSLPKGTTYEGLLQSFRDAGHNVIASRDEVKKPSGHATGPHWHFRFGASSVPLYDPDLPEDGQVPTPAESNAGVPEFDPNLPTDEELGDLKAKEVNPQRITLPESKPGEMPKGFTSTPQPAQDPFLQEPAADSGAMQRIQLQGGEKLPEQDWLTSGADSLNSIAQYVEQALLGTKGDTFDLSRDGKDWSTRVGEALTAPGVLENPYNNPIIPIANSLMRLLNAGGEAFAGTPFEGAAEAFPAGALETFGTSQAARAARLDSQQEALYTALLNDPNVPASVVKQFLNERGLDIDESLVAQRKAEAQKTGQQYGAVYQDPNAPEVPGTPAVKAVEEPSSAPAPDAPALKVEAPKPKKDRLSTDEIDQHVQSVHAGWQNAPEYEVVQSSKELPKDLYDSLYEKGMEDDVLGFHLNGKVTYIADNIPKDLLPSVTFHESLGHYGLSETFGDNLGVIVKEMYTGNKKFRDEVDAWRKDPENHGAYEDYDDPIIHIAEEVLAEKANAGKLDAKTFAKVKAIVKGYARKAGLKLNYSDQEIATIVAMSHDRVVSGKKFTNSGEISNVLRMPKFRIAKDSDLSAQERINQERAKARQEKGLRDIADRQKRDRLSRATDDYQRMKEGRPTSTDLEELDRQFDRDIGPKPAYMMRRSTEQARAKTKGRLLLEQKKAAQKAELEARRAAAVPKTPKAPKDKAGPIGLGKFPDASPSFKELAKDTAGKQKDVLGYTQTHAETKFFGKLLNMTEEEMLNLNDVMRPEEIYQAGEVYRRTGTRATNLMDRIEAGDETDETLGKFLDSLTKFDPVSEKFGKLSSDAGRLLNALKIAHQQPAAQKIAMMAKAFKRAGVTGMSTPDEMRAAIKKFRKEQRAQEQVDKAVELVSEVWNLPKSMKSSLDVSAPFRQGIFLVGEKEFWKSMVPMYKALVSPKFDEKQIVQIKGRPTYKSMVRSGLALSDKDGPLSRREEAFMSKWAENMPVFGIQVRASERAYRTYLNVLRADTFDSIVRDFRNLGLHPDLDELKLISNFVNSATGRGGLGKFTEAATHLNSVFYSPRLATSRLQMLTLPMRPSTYLKMPKPLRKRALKAWFSFAGITATAVGLGAYFSDDAKTEGDPRSSDFWKLKIGNTRYDLMGGFLQYITQAARQATGERKTQTGKIKKMGESPVSPSAWDEGTRFIRTKLSPTAGEIVNYKSGKNVIGEKYKYFWDTMSDNVEKYEKGEWKKMKVPSLAHLFVPMILEDTYDLATDKKSTALRTAISVPLAAHGIGVQTYPPFKPKKKD